MGRVGSGTARVYVQARRGTGEGMDETPEAPSGLPDDIEEGAPLGVEDAEPDQDAPDERGQDAMPGISTDEPDVSG